MPDSLSTFVLCETPVNYRNAGENIIVVVATSLDEAITAVFAERGHEPSEAERAAFVAWAAKPVGAGVVVNCTVISRSVMNIRPAADAEPPARQA
jgi:hypothetical protein